MRLVVAGRGACADSRTLRVRPNTRRCRRFDLLTESVTEPRGLFTCEVNTHARPQVCRHTDIADRLCWPVLNLVLTDANARVHRSQHQYPDVLVGSLGPGC